MKKHAVKDASFFENRKLLIGIVVSIAAVARLVSLLQFRSSVFWSAIWSDAATYNQWARKIIETGDWIGSQPFFMAPLYPYFLASVYSLFGIDITALRILQHCVAVCTVVMIFLIGERLFSRKVGFFAGIIAALYGPFVFYGNLLLVETLKVFFGTTSLYLCILARQKQEAHWWFVAGISIGGAILCRPSDALMAGAVVAWIMFGINDDLKYRLKSVVLLLSAIVLLILPITIRNYVVSGEITVLTTNGGLNFYLGNNPRAVGIYYNVDQLDLANDPDGRIYLETTYGKGFSHAESSTYWRGQAFDYVWNRPSDFIALLFKKLLLVFHYKEISQLGYNYRFIEQYGVSVLGILPTFLFVFPLAAVGMYVTIKEWRKYSVLYIFLAAQILGIILFFVTDRFRLSILPYLILFESAGIAWIVEWWKNRDRKDLLLPTVVFCAAIGIAWPFNVEIVDEYSTEHEYVGLQYFDLKMYDRALFEFRLALQSKESFHIHNNIGNVFAATGNLPAALSEYRRGHEINPRQAISTFSMGTAFVRAQRWDSASVYFQRAKAINPRFAPAYLNAGLTYYYLGKYGDALENLQTYLSMEPDREKIKTLERDIESLKRLQGERRLNP